MPAYTFTPEFNIGDTAFLNINNGDEVLITNVMYEVLTNLIKYQIMDENGTKGWYYAFELTDTKILR